MVPHELGPLLVVYGVRGGGGTSVGVRWGGEREASRLRVTFQGWRGWHMPLEDSSPPIWD